MIIGSFVANRKSFSKLVRSRFEIHCFLSNDSLKQIFMVSFRVMLVNNKVILKLAIKQSEFFWTVSVANSNESLIFSIRDQIRNSVTKDLVTFTEEILNGKLLFYAVQTNLAWLCIVTSGNVFALEKWKKFWCHSVSSLKLFLNKTSLKIHAWPYSPCISFCHTWLKNSKFDMEVFDTCGLVT